LGRAATTIDRLIGKGLGLLAAGGFALALGGCGGVEFKGKLFDYAGLSDVGKPQQDVRMTDRAPLILPPNTLGLPPPGSPAITRVDWPADTDKQRKELADARQAAERAKAAAKADPTNPYAGKPNLLDKVLGRYRKPEEDTVDVPEPDPSDKTAADKARERAAATPQKPVDQSLNAPTTPAGQDPFHPAAPDSYKDMSNGNNANY
jgi:hypothetical protein